jgi:23S rRNA pseudouridine2605 synthase
MARLQKPRRKGKGTSFGKRSDAEKSFLKRGRKKPDDSFPSRSAGSPRFAPSSYGKPAGKSFSKSYRHRDLDAGKNPRNQEESRATEDHRPTGGLRKPPFRKTPGTVPSRPDGAPATPYRAKPRTEGADSSRGKYPRPEGRGNFKKPFAKSGGPSREGRNDREHDRNKKTFDNPSRKSFVGSRAEGRKYPKPEGRRNFKKSFPPAGSLQREGRNDREEDRNKKSSDKPARKSFVESRIVRSGDFVKTVRAPETSTTAPAKDDSLIRLNKYIANSGVGSRREADKLIEMGLISVNGTTITELGTKVKRTDVVRYEDRVLKVEKNVYILLNKPKGFITTTDDPQERNTVMGLVAGACKERVYPVGRLDRNTTGLLLITNDGDMADKLTHPSYKAKKVYKAELDKPLTKNDAQQILSGVMLEEGRALVDDLAIISDDGKTVGLEIHIGWNRVVRRIFESLGYTVVKLDRSVYAGLDKKELSRGQWRFLKPEEIVRLKHFK